MKVFGIDLSCWQKGYPYAKATKEGVKFAILRAGFWTTKDSVFETHYKEARKQKWDIGAYWYSYATTEAQARMEAKAFIKAIAGKQFEYPVYVDIEDKSLSKLSKTQIDKNIIAFADEMKKAGYLFGVYTNTSWYTSKLNGKKLNKSYEWWIAQWSTTPPKNINYGLWQFGGATNYIRSPKIAGVTTDQDYAVTDYLTYIKANGLNGYEKPTPDPKPTPTPKPTYTTGNYKCLYNMKVRDGVWGNVKRVSQLTADGKKNATSKSLNAQAVYKKGTIFTAKKIVMGTDGSIWGVSPSGYICIKDNKQIYCEKC